MKRRGNDLFDKNFNYLNAIKKKGFARKPAFLIENFHTCHHCKNFLHNNYMMQCKYKSSLMGLPIMNKKPWDLSSFGNYFCYYYNHY